MKSKLGISVGLIAALTYLIALFGGYIPLLLVVGYILICEQQRWLKVSAVKALVVVIGFSLISAIIGFIPNLLSLVNTFVNNDGLKIVELYYEFTSIINKIISFITTLLTIAEKVLLLLLGFFAVGQKSFNLGFIDKFITKHFPLETPTVTEE
jgi:hypothetical protein